MMPFKEKKNVNTTNQNNSNRIFFLDKRFQNYSDLLLSCIDRLVICQRRAAFLCCAGGAAVPSTLLLRLSSCHCGRLVDTEIRL